MAPALNRLPHDAILMVNASLKRDGFSSMAHTRPEATRRSTAAAAFIGRINVGGIGRRGNRWSDPESFREVLPSAAAIVPGF
jgi:hypothetical protein